METEQLEAFDFSPPEAPIPDNPLDLNEKLVVNPESTFFMQVVGCGLEQRGIYDGDMLIVDKSLSPGPGQVVVEAENDEFVLREAGKEHDSAKMCGVVVYCIHDLGFCP